MSTIEPGTPVCVIIEGTATPERRGGRAGEYLAIETGGHSFDLWPDHDPAVQVVPVDPELVPIEWIIAAHVETSDIDREQCACDWSSEEVTHVEHLAGELRAWAAKGGTLIEAAHPGLIR